MASEKLSFLVQPGLPSPEQLDVLESVTDAFASIGSNWQLLYVNPAFERMTGRSRRDLAGKRYFDEFPGTIGTALEQRLREAMRDRAANTLDDYRDSQNRWYEIRLFPASLGGLAVYWRDMSDHKNALEALRKSQEWLRLAQDAADVGLWDWDAVADSTTASDSYYRLYGLPPGSRFPNHAAWLATLHPDDRDRVERDVSIAVSEGRVYHSEFRVVHPDGSVHWLLGKGRVMVDATGCATRMLGVNIDITALKDAGELARSNEELQRFAYAASHDLRDPLRVIRESAMTLERNSAPSLDPHSRDLIRVITDATARMISLTDGLLRYAMLGGADQLRRESVAMNTVFDWAVLHLRPAIKECGALIERGDLPELEADQSRMIQLFQNLLSNALKYRDRERRVEVRVSAERSGSGWLFRVKDNGIGIPAAQQERIFNLFHRLHGKEVSGAGIGLASCRRIVESHGGGIGVESQKDAGSTFWFTLPA